MVDKRFTKGWQWMTMVDKSMTMNDNGWQKVYKKDDNEWQWMTKGLQKDNNEWQKDDKRMTKGLQKDDNEWQKDDKRMIMNDNGWQKNKCTKCMELW